MYRASARAPNPSGVCQARILRGRAMKTLLTAALLSSCVALAAEPCATAQACFAEGMQLERSPKVEVRAQAAAAYERGCELNDMRACTNAADMYFHAETGRKDEKRAAALRKRACDGGAALACSDLGIQYEDGAGVPKNVALAATLYAIACEGQVYGGCHNLALLKADAGQHLAALDWFKKACALNMRAPSCEAILDEANALTPAEKKREAARVNAALKLACEAGVSEACR